MSTAAIWLLRPIIASPILLLPLTCPAHHVSSKVKYIQRALRSFFIITQYRISLIQTLLEACILPLAFHINLITSGKGLDLHNLSPLEASQLKSHVGQAKLRLIKDMATSSFHGYLRLNLSKIIDYHRDYVASNKIYHDTLLYRQHLLSKFIFAKRKRFVDILHQLKAIDIDSHEVTLEEARCFIRFDQDRVSQHVMKMEARLDRWYQTRALKNTPFRPSKQSISVAALDNLRSPEAATYHHQQERQQEPEVLLVPLMLLLSMITPQDVIEIFLELSDQ
jgi:hypothetical protein